MNASRRWLILVTGVVLVLAVAVAVYPSFSQFERGPLTELSLQPQAVLLPEGNDPRDVMVGVHWLEAGWCKGQFSVRATETTTEVRVGTVVSRLYANDVCAGMGTSNNMAWADLTLASPLGSRAVVRNSDGARLPVLAS
jgi:hypothetical protein